jgi:hypothetical protein
MYSLANKKDHFDRFTEGVTLVKARSYLAISTLAYATCQLAQVTPLTAHDSSFRSI